MLLEELATPGMTFGSDAGTIDITGVTADSRAVEPGFLFAALGGSATHGARFVAEAVGRGAAAILAGLDVDLDAAGGTPVARADDPRRALALIASRVHPRQPEKIVAVTGTSGKTSVVSFVRQILSAAGREAASIGTIGVRSRRWTGYGGLTTPDPIALHAALERLADDGVTHLALEASSQGLDQRRLDGVRLTAAGFTNLGRDHMDYHASIDDYLAAKLRLFTVVLPRGGTAVIDMDGARAADVCATARAAGQRMIGVGRAGSDIRLIGITAESFRQVLRVEAFGRRQDIVLPLAGAFQASNALVAAGLAIAAGLDPEAALASLSSLEGAPGRLELVGRKANGAMIFVDYAHKPEALAAALGALRPLATGRLAVVIGAGGDRDPGKRPLMGRAAAECADIVVVTDDNPRSEDPAMIRAAVLAGAPGAMEIGDRGEAIRRAIAMLAAGDVLCIAGKGHETGQVVGGTTLPFSDHEAVHAALATGEAA